MTLHSLPRLKVVSEQLDAGSALARADVLAGDGRFLDAVDLLTEVNRRDPDATIDVRLVNLRNAAYAELDRSPTNPRWPDQGPLRDRDLVLCAVVLPG